MHAPRPVQAPLSNPRDDLETSSCQPYQYEPLNEEEREIRLMTLLPGEFSSKIRFHLHKERFEDDSMKEFEALSYAWGSTENLVDIFVGEAGHQIIQVTRNLADALLYLRHREKLRVLWIDAISVNQQDLQERSSQVKRMPDIYSKATRVVIWLGLESKDSALAMECAETISSNITADWFRSIMYPRQSDTATHWTDTNLPLPFEDFQAQSIFNLLDRSRFRRLWVWQEVQLARDVMVACGPRSIPWAAICDTVFCCSQKSLTFNELTLKTPIRLLLNLCGRQRLLPIDIIMIATQDALCSDPRDKVYAILSLLKRREGVNIEPDYTKNTTEVYRDVVLQYLNSGYPRILASVEMQNDFYAAPSWIPGWSVPKVTQGVDKVLDLATLQITGTCIANIETAEAFNFRGEMAHLPDYMQPQLQKVFKKLELDGESISSRQVLLELCEVLCCGWCAELLRFPGPPCPTLEVCSSFIEKTLKGDMDNISEEGKIENEKTLFWGTVLAYSIGRSLFRSTDGSFGVSPQAVKPGDMISVVLGLDNALILRPVGNTNYKIVGQAYYYGVMNGEALLGPFPDAVKPVSCKDVTGLYYNAYLDEKSGIVTAEDPRWPALPPSWQLVQREQNVPLFICNETGEKTTRHPCLTREELEKRGVKLEVFNII
ncbi:Heterokaryon incompatibility protein (HET) domain containing protein [Hyaloscypha variabilis]